MESWMYLSIVATIWVICFSSVYILNDIKEWGFDFEFIPGGLLLVVFSGAWPVTLPASAIAVVTVLLSKQIIKKIRER